MAPEIPEIPQNPEETRSVDELRERLAELNRRIAELEDARKPALRWPKSLRGPRRMAVVAVAVIALAATPLLALAQTFGDVPPSNPFYSDIQALVAAGVTSGCGGGNYCPSANVTREQMAAFMNRLGALQAGKTPVVNADKVDGIQGWSFLRYGATVPNGQLLTGTYAFSDSGQPGTEITGEDNIEFAVPLPYAPKVHIINRGSPVPSGCSGTVTAPNASAGNLCIWVGFSSEGDTLDGYYSVTTGFQNTSSNLGVAVFLHDDDHDGFVEGAGTWAARSSTTAPSAASVPSSTLKGSATSAGH